MKTVPTVRLADTTDAAGLPDLPEEVRLAMTDIAGAAREGLLAMSVAAGMAVMAAMFDAEIAQACGPKGKHEPGRAAVRHGAGRGSVTLGGRRVPVDRPRARTVDGHEVPLSSYSHFAADDMLAQVVMERMLAGVATRRHARVAEPVGTEVDKEAKSTSRSAISRRFVKQTETALGELMARDLAGEDIKVLMLDGEHMAERCVVVALAITADGTKKPVGLWDGATENKTVVRSLLADLVERGLNVRRRAAGGPRRRQGIGGSGAGGVRRQGPDPKMHPAQAAKCRRPPAGQGQGLGGRQAGQGVRPSRPRAGAAQR